METIGLVWRPAHLEKASISLINSNSAAKSVRISIAGQAVFIDEEPANQPLVREEV
jgi:hypothetical protein